MAEPTISEWIKDIIDKDKEMAECFNKEFYMFSSSTETKLDFLKERFESLSVRVVKILMLINDKLEGK